MQIFFAAIIMGVYLFTRLLRIHLMGEYFDYDEGTYLMMARLINHGYLPYRDVFAVHPPLYYYLLALWLRIFGDSYITGRLLSVILGLISLIVAYFTGKEVRDWKLGAAFASLLAADPLMIYMNSRVFHETVIELFTLLALYFFVRYFKTENLRYAYLSLFLAGIGSTAKFTIIPFLIALYLTIILSLSAKSWRHFGGMIDAIFTSKQILIILLAYIAAALAVVSIVTAYPEHIVRLLAVVPGIHPVNLVGHKYTASLFLLLWGILTVYILDLSYVRKLIETVKILIKNWRVEVKLGLAVLAAKALVEAPLGVFVSRNYISQTYLSQSGRYLPFLGFFSLLNKIIRNLSQGSPEFLVYLLPILLLLFWIMLGIGRGFILREEKHLAGLLVLNILMFLFLIPILPGERFIYPMLIVAYLTALSSLLSLQLSGKKVLTALMISLLLFSLTDYGMLVNYPEGRLKLAWGEHTNEMRHDLRTYLDEHNLHPGLCMSVNPMNAYYLNLKIDPYLLDTFGLAYLKRENPAFLLERIRSRNTSCIILSTWMYAIMGKDRTLNAAYGTLQNYTLTSGTLRFAESYSDGEVLEFFTTDDASREFSISTHYGKLYLWINGTVAGKLYLKQGNTSFNAWTQLLFKEKSGSYEAYSFISAASDRETVKTLLELGTSSLRVKIPENTTAVFEFSGVAVKMDGEPLKAGETVSAVYLYLRNMRFMISAKHIWQEDGKIMADGSEIVLGCGGSDASI
ncbi:ArnT family glycosyltransferase [Thermococcus sp.]